MNEPSRYIAFISYSHADERVASWLHKSIELYPVPKRLVGQASPLGPIPARLKPLFRDRDELASSADLSTSIKQALEQSAFLIVICSPRAAKSKWVNEEILAFQRMGKSDRILALIVEGEPAESFPEAIRSAEPIAADLRPARDGKRGALLKLLAGLLGVGFDSLRQRDLVRRQRRLAMTLAVTVVLVVVMAGLAAWGWISSVRAERSAEEARAQTARATANLSRAQEAVDTFYTSVVEEKLGKDPALAPLRGELMKTAARYYFDLLQDNKDDQVLPGDALHALRVLIKLIETANNAAATITSVTDGREMLAQLDFCMDFMPRVPEGNHTDLDTLAAAYRSVAGALEQLGDSESAKHGYQQAEILYRQMCDAALMSACSSYSGVLRRQANLAVDIGDVDEARSVLTKYIASLRELSSRKPNAITGQALSRLALLMAKFSLLDDRDADAREWFARSKAWLLPFVEDKPDYYPIQMDEITEMQKQAGFDPFEKPAELPDISDVRAWAVSGDRSGEGAESALSQPIMPAVDPSIAIPVLPADDIETLIEWAGHFVDLVGVVENHSRALRIESNSLVRINVGGGNKNFAEATGWRIRTGQPVRIRGYLGGTFKYATLTVSGSTDCTFLTETEFKSALANPPPRAPGFAERGRTVTGTVLRASLHESGLRMNLLQTGDVEAISISYAALPRLWLRYGPHYEESLTGQVVVVTGVIDSIADSPQLKVTRAADVVFPGLAPVVASKEIPPPAPHAVITNESRQPAPLNTSSMVTGRIFQTRGLNGEMYLQLEGQADDFRMVLSSDAWNGLKQQYGQDLQDRLPGLVLVASGKLTKTGRGLRFRVEDAEGVVLTLNP